jgi:hypothetical protein
VLAALGGLFVLGVGNGLFEQQNDPVGQCPLILFGKLFERSPHAWRNPRLAMTPTLFLIPHLNETLHLPLPIIFGLSLRRE